MGHPVEFNDMAMMLLLMEMCIGPLGAAASAVVVVVAVERTVAKKRPSDFCPRAHTMFNRISGKFKFFKLIRLNKYSLKKLTENKFSFEEKKRV